jgi:ArsR family transcriptional regulator, cadmium/lead-responsive transcriptional repressor
MAELLVERHADVLSEPDPLERLGVALSDPTRRTVLMVLSTGPAYPSELALLCGTTASNLSNHLACLRGCGLVVGEREGRKIRYELAAPELATLLKRIESVMIATQECSEHLP